MQGLHQIAHFESLESSSGRHSLVPALQRAPLLPRPARPAGLIAHHVCQAGTGRSGSLTPWEGYGGIQQGRPASEPPAQPAPTSPTLSISKSILGLIAVNALVFTAAVFWRSDWALAFALPSVKISWWQYLSSAFVHAHISQLSRNVFFMWIFGEILRKEVTGANIASLHFVPGGKALLSSSLLGLGPTAGVLGVAIAALALSARPSLSWLLAAALTAQYAITALVTTPIVPGVLPVKWLSSSVANGGQGLLQGGHIGSVIQTLTSSPNVVWLWGVLAGAALTVVLARLPVPAEGDK